MGVLVGGWGWVRVAPESPEALRRVNPRGDPELNPKMKPPNPYPTHGVVYNLSGVRKSFITPCSVRVNPVWYPLRLRPQRRCCWAKG